MKARSAPAVTLKFFGATHVSNPFEQNLDKNSANYQPLTPLSFLARTALAAPEHIAIIHGKMRISYAEFYRRCRQLASALAARGIGFRSLTENIDTTTSGGMLVFNIFGSLAQFERDLIRERTHAGLKAARERGNKGGRRPVVTPDKLRKARAHIAAGLTVREAAARLKIGKTALYKALENA